MGLPIVVADYRERKILKRFQVTPGSPVLLLGVELTIYICYAIVIPSTRKANSMRSYFRLQALTSRETRDNLGFLFSSISYALSIYAIASSMR